MQNIHPGPKSAFLLKNLSRGLLWFIFLITGYLFLKNYINLDFEKWLEPVFANNVLIFTVYVLSEFIFGIIPPELFMLWALRTGNVIDYSMYVLLFAIPYPCCSAHSPALFCDKHVSRVFSLSG
ncbi:MAG: hypothetical protein B6D61_12980 [Bacteroidetes bacterium 4484_249]|nr:MAG: hypothetical protein B6D61_12980 [Bacteroidetes bacterium 4484_249]